MNKKQIYFKSDFTVILDSEAGWGGCPFRLSFYTSSPSRSFVACFDGENYHNCRLLDDGRLEVAINQNDGCTKNLLGIGTLMCAPEFYLDNDAFRDHICNEFVKPFVVTVIDKSWAEPEAFSVGELQNDDGVLWPAYEPEKNTSNAFFIAAGCKAKVRCNVTNAGLYRCDSYEQNAMAESVGVFESGEIEFTADKDTFIFISFRAFPYDGCEIVREVGDECNIYLGLEGERTLTTAGTLPAYYQKGDPGLTPEEHDALVSETQAAHNAAETAMISAKAASEGAEHANESAKQTLSAIEKAAEAAHYANEAGQLAIDSSYEAKDAAKDAKGIYETVKGAYESGEFKGDKGDKGDTGQQGMQGDTGPQGERGLQGEKGEPFRYSDFTPEQLEGLRGPRGYQGETGPAGPVGPQGPKGDKGDSITMFPNVTIFGQPTIQKSQISNFSANNYLQFPFVVDFAGRPWQIDCAITTGSNVSQQHNVLDSAFGLAFAFSGGKFVLALSSDGTSWNLGATSGTHTILANTTYYIRISWDGSVYKLAYSTDKETWVDDITVTSSASLASKQIIIGKSLDNRYIFNGSINMSEAHLTISGKIVWEGMDDAGLATRMAIDLSNIDEEGKQRVNQIVNDGEVGQKLSELDTKKQDKLVSGTNIKTVNGKNLLGSGNIEIQGGGGGDAADRHIVVGGQICRLITIDRPFDNMYIYVCECAGYLWFSSSSSSKKILRYDIATGDVKEISGIQFYQPTSKIQMSYDNNGHIWWSGGSTNVMYKCDLELNNIASYPLGLWSSAHYCNGYIWQCYENQLIQRDLEFNVVKTWSLTKSYRYYIYGLQDIYGAGHTLINNRIIYDPLTDEIYELDNDYILAKGRIGGIVKPSWSVPDIITGYDAVTHTFTTVQASNKSTSLGINVEYFPVNEGCIVGMIRPSITSFSQTNGSYYRVIINSPLPIPIDANYDISYGWIVWAEDDKIKLINTLGEWL